MFRSKLFFPKIEPENMVFTYIQGWLLIETVGNEDCEALGFYDTSSSHTAGKGEPEAQEVCEIQLSLH